MNTNSLRIDPGLAIAGACTETVGEISNRSEIVVGIATARLALGVQRSSHVSRLRARRRHITGQTVSPRGPRPVPDRTNAITAVSATHHGKYDAHNQCCGAGPALPGSLQNT